MDLERSYMTGATARGAEFDQGLRSYMLGVYNYMATALAVTGFVALATAMMSVSDGQLTSFGQVLFLSPLKWVIMFAPLGMVFLFASRVDRMAASTLQTLFWVYSVLMGVSLASIFLVYTGESIARVFFVTAAAFAGLSLFGYTTKRDLSGMATFLFMGLIGVVIASLVNLFLGSTMIQFMISVAGVVVFAGLTAYDTQRIKLMYVASEDGEVTTKKSIMGALSLYLDFINLFLMLLSLFGNRE